MRLEIIQVSSSLANQKQALNLAVKEGETVCVSGDSGIGKSVLLRCLADLMPHEGETRLDGISSQLIPAHEWRMSVCLLPAESHWWYVTVGEYFQNNIDASEQFDLTCLMQLGLSSDVMRWRIDRLSTGEKQRLSLLRVLHNKPKVLLLDEPTASLDPVTIRKAEDCIGQYQQESKCSIIWVSHDPAQIRRVANRHIHLDSTGYEECVL